MKGVARVSWVPFKRGEAVAASVAVVAPWLSGLLWHANIVPKIKIAAPIAAHELWNERTVRGRSGGSRPHQWITVPSPIPFSAIHGGGEYTQPEGRIRLMS